MSNLLPFNLDVKRTEILSTDGHLLVEGGPGSGKTTIALLKAKELIAGGRLERGQKILFLSFARATVSRVEEQAGNLITAEHKKHVEVNTYHGFTWQLIQTFGYLVRKFRSFKLLTPPHLQALSSNIEKMHRDDFKRTLLADQGLLCFDLFCELASEILQKSKRIRTLLSSKYPYIIVDEFQDTDSHEWAFIKLFGEQSTVFALADLNQRIFEFRGASITRIPEFKETFKGVHFDLGSENNRSGDTDIAVFGDDLLTGANKGKTYTDVKVIQYLFHKTDHFFYLKIMLAQRIRELKKKHPDNKWSLAILVRGKKDTLQISSYLSTCSTPGPFYHEVMIDPAGPALAAQIIARLLEPLTDADSAKKILIQDVLNHIKGHSSQLTQKSLKFAEGIEKYFIEGKVQGKTRQQFLEEIDDILTKREELRLTGSPAVDWLAVRNLFSGRGSEFIRHVHEDSQFIKLLKKGAVLSEGLAEAWRTTGAYTNAFRLIDVALTQEHFAATSRKWEGIFVMNVHKAKGKEFDEVLMWEAPYKTLVIPDKNQQVSHAERIVMRVGVTRARERTTILTPQWSPSIIL